MMKAILFLIAVAIAQCFLAVAVMERNLFENPIPVTSVNGILNVSIVDELSWVNINGNRLRVRVWNKQFTGPLLRVKRGDRVIIRLQNFLDEITNLHFHGMHISPLTPADDTLTYLAGDGSIRIYNFTIPLDHPQGLFWYHSHAHGLSEYQIFNGMSGALIVDGLLDPFPTLAGIQEQVILLRDLQINTNK